jgi:protein translocase SecG subunit
MSLVLILQIIISLLLIVSILLQQRGTALGSAFGQSGGFYLQRRGLEKKLFIGTIVLAALLIITSILGLMIESKNISSL